MGTIKEISCDECRHDAGCEFDSKKNRSHVRYCIAYQAKSPPAVRQGGVGEGAKEVGNPAPLVITADQCAAVNRVISAIHKHLSAGSDWAKWLEETVEDQIEVEGQQP